MRIAFLGLGSMGTPMAANISRSDHELVVWNRTRGKADGLDGAAVAGSPAEAAEGANVVLTMLSDDEAVESVVFGDDGALVGMAEGAVHASMSTISPELSRRLADAHGARGQRYVAAPVFGAAGRRRQGQAVGRRERSSRSHRRVPTCLRGRGAGGDHRGPRAGAGERHEARGQLHARLRHRGDGRSLHARARARHRRRTLPRDDGEPPLPLAHLRELRRNDRSRPVRTGRLRVEPRTERRPLRAARRPTRSACPCPSPACCATDSCPPWPAGGARPTGRRWGAWPRSIPAETRARPELRCLSSPAPSGGARTSRPGGPCIARRSPRQAPPSDR